MGYLPEDTVVRAALQSAEGRARLRDLAGGSNFDEMEANWLVVLLLDELERVVALDQPT